MQKQLTQFKSVINDIETVFHFEQTCPLSVAKEAVLECLKWLGQIEDAAKAAAVAQAEATAESKPQDAASAAPVT